MSQASGSCSVIKLAMGVLLGAAVGAAAVAATRSNFLGRSGFSRSSAMESGTETVVVFIVSGSCGASRDDSLKVAMREDRSRMVVEANSRGSHLRFIGVATDGSFESGARLLSEFGAFDELVLGSGWMNEALVRFIWRDLSGPPELPQLVVLRRRVDVESEIVRIGPDEAVVRLLGAKQIKQWLRDPRSKF